MSPARSTRSEGPLLVGGANPHCALSFADSLRTGAEVRWSRGVKTPGELMDGVCRPDTQTPLQVVVDLNRCQTWMQCCFLAPACPLNAFRSCRRPRRADATELRQMHAAVSFDQGHVTRLRQM
jgi:hypothetical protein